MKAFRLMIKNIFLVFSIVVYAQSEVDVDKLFHANPPVLSPIKLTNTQKQQQIDPSNSVATDFSEDEFNPYRGSRHDEFDWALTKVRSDNLL